MKKTFVALAFILGLLAITTPAFANAPENITIMGNGTSEDYLVEYMNTTQLNTTLNSTTNAWYRLWINISFNNDTVTSSKSVSIAFINFTLPDIWVQNSTTSVVLYNITHDVFLEAANTTYSEDADYGRVQFNLTDLCYNGTRTIGLCNVSIYNDSTTNQEAFKLFAIDYKLDTLDSHRAQTTSADGIHKTANATYPAPSNVSLNLVTVFYQPSDWSSIDAITEVNSNGTIINETAVGNGYVKTVNGLRLNEPWNFTKAYNYTFLKISYTIGETGKGGTGAGRSPPMGIIPTVPGVTSTTILIITSIMAVIGVSSTLLLWWKYR